MVWNEDRTTSNSLLVMNVAASLNISSDLVEITGTIAVLGQHFLEIQTKFGQV